MSSLVELAEKILANAKQIEDYVTATKSLSDAEQSGPRRTPSEISQARLELLDAAHELKYREEVQKPETALVQTLYGYTDILALRAVYTLKLPQAVPLQGSISYEEVARSVGVNQLVLRRLFHYAITLHIFTEPEPDRIAHSAASRHLVEVPAAFDAIGLAIEDLAPSSLKTIEALQTHPQATEPNETGYNIAHGTNLSFYRALAQEPERARRFGAGMRYFVNSSNYDLDHLIAAFPWHEHDKPGFTVVDVGGGQGGVSTRLASETKNMRFVVQDLEGTAQDGANVLPQELKGRVEFMGHDFFSPQPVTADVYFLRWILHNWSDKYCQDILRSLTPALKPGARVLLYENERQDGPDARLREKDSYYLDVVMLSCWNGAVRTESDWKRLFAASDSRFVFTGITRNANSAMSLIEAVWSG